MKIRLLRYLSVAAALLAVDWVLGCLNASGVLPLWPFVAVNFPCGLPHAWLESHWAATHYEVGGRTIDEAWSFVTFLFTPFAQAWLYLWLIDHWQGKAHKVTPSAAAQPPAVSRQ